MIALVRVLIAGVAVLVSATACSTNDDGSTSSTQSTPTFDPAGCPAGDEVFCESAAAAANALAAGSADALIELSRADSIDCVEVAQEYFPQCRADDVLTGQGLSDADLIVELVPGDAYRDQLEAIISRP